MENSTPQPIDYAAVLAEMKRQREALDKGIAGIEAMLGLAPSGPALGDTLSATATVTNPPTEISHDSFFGMSISAAAQKFLSMRKRPQTTADIAGALQLGGFPHQSGNFGNTVGSVLTRNTESKAPIFVRVKRGTWGLRAWYPNYRPKSKDDSVDEEVDDGTKKD